MKIILDTNVVIAAYAARGLCHELFELCMDRHTLITSEDILQETKKNLKKQLGLPENLVESVLRMLREKSQLHDYETLPSPVCRDADDDKILALAKSSGADMIITGDPDLLVLEKFESTIIVSPRQFWERLKKKEVENKTRD